MKALAITIVFSMLSIGLLTLIPSSEAHPVYSECRYREKPSQHSINTDGWGDTGIWWDFDNGHFVIWSGPSDARNFYYNSNTLEPQVTPYHAPTTKYLDQFDPTDADTWLSGQVVWRGEASCYSQCNDDPSGEVYDRLEPSEPLPNERHSYSMCGFSKE